MKKILLGVAAFFIGTGITLAGPLEYHGTSLSGDAVLKSTQTFTGQPTFEGLVTISTDVHITATHDSAQVEIVNINNLGTGDISNLKLEAASGTDPGLLIRETGSSVQGKIFMDTGTDELKLTNTNGCSIANIVITASGNLEVRSCVTGNSQLLLFDLGAIRYFNFESELAASAGNTVLKSTDVASSSELFVENEANEKNQLSGDATFQAVLSSSGPFTLFSLSAATLTSTTPLAQGEMYFNTGANKLFISTGTGIGQWAASDDYTEGP